MVLLAESIHNDLHPVCSQHFRMKLLAVPLYPLKMADCSNYSYNIITFTKHILATSDIKT